MKWFNNIKIYKKLVLGFFIIAMIAAAVGFFGVNNIREIVNADKLLYEENTISEEELISQGYRKYETLQGYYWTKEELTENGDSAEYTRTMYFSPELTALLKGDTGAKRKASRATGMMNTDSTTNDVLSKADYAGYVYNLGDFVNDTSANPANLSRVGNGMQVLGGAVLAGQVIMGMV
jgi:hypothetical protein